MQSKNCQFLVNKRFSHFLLFPSAFSLSSKGWAFLHIGWGERCKLGLLLSVTSLITGESRVITFDSFDVTAECDATVICDEMMLQKMPEFLAAFREFLSVF